MIANLTPEQLNIVDRATRLFGNITGDGKVWTLFRKNGRDMSVMFCCSERRQHFIVRTTIPHSASDFTIDDLCGQAVIALRDSVGRVLRNTA